MKNNKKANTYSTIIDEYCSDDFGCNLIRDDYIDEFKYIVPEITRGTNSFVIESIHYIKLEFAKFLVPEYADVECIPGFIEVATNLKRDEIVDYLKSIQPKKKNPVETFCKEHQIDLTPMPILAIECNAVFFLMEGEAVMVQHNNIHLIDEYSKRVDGLKYDNLFITKLGMKHLYEFIDEIENKDFLRDLLDYSIKPNDSDSDNEEKYKCPFGPRCTSCNDIEGDESDSDSDSENEEECKCESDCSESVVSKFSTISLSSPTVERSRFAAQGSPTVEAKKIDSPDSYVKT